MAKTPSQELLRYKIDFNNNVDFAVGGTAESTVLGCQINASDPEQSDVVVSAKSSTALFSFQTRVINTESTNSSTIFSIACPTRHAFLAVQQEADQEEATPQFVLSSTNIMYDAAPLFHWAFEIEPEEITAASNNVRTNTLLGYLRHVKSNRYLSVAPNGDDGSLRVVCSATKQTQWRMQCNRYC
jgi:hypothetical protein